MLKPFEHGYTTGKFAPMHRGHELLFSFAASVCRHLTIHLTYDRSDKYPISLRKTWIETYFRAYHPDVRLSFFEFPEIDYSSGKDDQGTIVDESYWNQYVKQVVHITAALHIPYFDCVIISDHYGKRVAVELNAEWIPVDPNRETFEISSTKVRQDTLKHHHQLSSIVKPDIARKIAIIGPESVGKSTLVRNVQRHFGDLVGTVPEWGRTLYEATSSDISERNFWSILNVQKQAVENKSRDHIVVVSDTESIVTSEFFRIWYPHSRQLGNFFTEANNLALSTYQSYIVLAPTVPLVQDGTRMGEEERQSMFREYCIRLRDLNIRHTIIDSPDFEERTDQAISVINEEIDNYL
ncbi:bifunctional NMN adenylyltransferase/transcriptional regulator protein [Rhizobium phage RHph_I1_18]|nr:bifunctional NMN adenylyltransferase/transcriptional regulator protein [Rhizobium phage RHph_I1_18]